MPRINIIDLVRCPGSVEVQDAYTKDEWATMAAKYDQRIVEQIDKCFTYQPPSAVYPDGLKIIKPRYNK